MQALTHIHLKPKKLKSERDLLHSDASGMGLSTSPILPMSPNAANQQHDVSLLKLSSKQVVCVWAWGNQQALESKHVRMTEFKFCMVLQAELEGSKKLIMEAEVCETHTKEREGVWVF